MPALPALSPSRAADFLQCPLLYRFRVIDRLEAPPSAAAARGTLVHSVLERIFDLPATERTPETAVAMIDDAWAGMLQDQPELGDLVPGEDALKAWVGDAATLVRRWFGLEDPTRLEPSSREQYVETEVGGLLLRGYIDRLDTSPRGDIRVVDYKTGRSPSEKFEGQALFQLKFYGLVLWRSTGVVPRLLQLVYLGNGEILRFAPDERDLIATERKITALWSAITAAAEAGDWRPRTSGRCSWCDYRQHCPEFGGTPPPLPPDAVQRALDPGYGREVPTS